MEKLVKSTVIKLGIFSLLWKLKSFRTHLIISLCGVSLVSLEMCYFGGDIYFSGGKLITCITILLVVLHSYLFSNKIKEDFRCIYAKGNESFHETIERMQTEIVRSVKKHLVGKKNSRKEFCNETDRLLNRAEKIYKILCFCIWFWVTSVGIPRVFSLLPSNSPELIISSILVFPILITALTLQRVLKDIIIEPKIRSTYIIKKEFKN